MRAVIVENIYTDDRKLGIPACVPRVAGRETCIGKYVVCLSIAKSDPLVTKRANQCVAIRPSIAVMDVWKWPGHPQTPPDEQEARAHPQQYYEHQRPHEPLPCDEDTTCN
jgi:hypothetical protein